jgi:uncharacterized integral membrane protein
MDTSDLGTTPTQGGAKAPRKRSSPEQARLAGVAVIAVIATAFAVLNLREVKVNYILGTGHAPLIIVIAASLAAGLALGLLAGRRGRKG